MKHLIVVASIITSISSMIAMECPKIEYPTTLEITNRELDTLKKPYITFINQLPTYDSKSPNALSPYIFISDQTNMMYYNNQPYQLDESAKMILPNQGLYFSPKTYAELPEYERLGMNNAQDAALIQIYVSAAVAEPLMQLIIGKGTKVQFGDEITFATKADNNIVLKHKDNILATLRTQRSIKIITQPTLFETTVARTLSTSQDLTVTNPIELSHNKDVAAYIKIINQLPKNDPNFPSTRIDISSAQIDASETTKPATYTNRSYSPDEESSTVIISADETREFPLNMDEIGNSAIILYIQGAIDNQLLQLNIGKDSKVKCGDTITVTPGSSGAIDIKYNNQKEALMSLNTQQMIKLIGQLEYQEKVDLYQSKNTADWFNDLPYIKAIMSRFSKTQ